MHFDPTGQDFLGVWLQNPDGLDSYYPADEGDDTLSDAHVYGTEAVTGAMTGIKFDAAVEVLTAVSPYVAWWAWRSRTAADVDAQSAYKATEGAPSA